MRTAERGDAKLIPLSPKPPPAAGGGGVANGLFVKSGRKKELVALLLLLLLPPPRLPAKGPSSPFDMAGAVGDKGLKGFDRLLPPKSSPAKGPLPTVGEAKGFEKLRPPKGPAGGGPERVPAVSAAALRTKGLVKLKPPKSVVGETEKGLLLSPAGGPPGPSEGLEPLRPVANGPAPAARVVEARKGLTAAAVPGVAAEPAILGGDWGYPGADDATPNRREAVRVEALAVAGGGAGAETAASFTAGMAPQPEVFVVAHRGNNGGEAKASLGGFAAPPAHGTPAEVESVREPAPAAARPIAPGLPMETCCSDSARRDESIPDPKLLAAAASEVSDGRGGRGIDIFAPSSLLPPASVSSPP